jgi:excisionase family DNA binding protein
MTNSDFLTVSEVAEEIRYCDRWVRELLKRGELPGKRTGKRAKWLVTRGALNEYKLRHGLLQESESKGKQSLLQPMQIDREAADISNMNHQRISRHDRKIFRESDNILNENRLDSLIVGNRFYQDEWQMLAEYLIFFDKVSQRYIDSDLRELCKTSNRAMERLLHFMEIHHEIVSSGEARGLLYKLYPGGDSERFYDYLTNDNTRPRAETRFGEKVDRLAKECQHAYKEYRSGVRETLFL